ncbi:uncharacterized protein LOC115088716 isoform X1 [Rhinatrema bivittatum]|uniref:uncharacterized protein LOC115088716 isoform X1 n=1 Tax=Rhinatrema bivittatum TaxID=194408 RepID=UPI00112B6E63|nr:uncharacterized protein LOC115088716 isoform X1 [Rhinatrema bivittatum]
MPHKRKGKIRIYPPLPDNLEGQRLIYQYATPTSVTRTSTPIGESGEGAQYSPGELSLTPPDPKTLIQAALLLDSVPAETPAGTSFEHAQLGGKPRDEADVGGAASARVSAEATGGEEYEASGEGTAEPVSPLIPQRLTKPAIVTLDALWDLVAGNAAKLDRQACKLEEVSKRMTKIETDHTNLEKALTKRGALISPGMGIDMENLTNFLETTTEEITERSALFVTLYSEIDVGIIMKNYFKNLNVSFMGGQVRIFPDLAKPTQMRRKKFISLRPKVLALGGTYILRYPCRCIVKLLGNTYVFFSPEQLQAFLEAREQTPQPIELDPVNESDV